jgi:hypothetical protein
MKILTLSTLSVSKVVVLATGLTAAILVATMSPQAAQAYPTKARDCSACHAVGGSVSAVPSTTTLAAGAAYTVLVTVPVNPAGTDTGYWIASSDAAGTTGSSVTFGGDTGTQAATYTAAMTAPATAGTAYYKVWATNGDTTNGLTNFVVYSVTVGSKTTTPPVTTTTPPMTETTTPPVTKSTALGAPNTRTGGTSGSSDGPLVGSGALALLLLGVGATAVVRRRRQVRGNGRS